MLLSPEQLQEIRQIIEDHHDAFIVNALGEEGVSKEVLQHLKDKGLVDVSVESIQDAYLYGQLVGQLQSLQVSNMSYDQFRSHIAKNPVPLSDNEKHAVQMAIFNAGQYCQGLGNTVSLDTGAIIIEGDAKLRAELESEIRTTTAENIARRETVKQLKTDLGWASKDWERDWDRIARTEKQTAMQTGVADSYRKEYGSGVRVAKIPMPDACPHCNRLHIGPDGQPRIFTLSTLENNGTNVGRKAADWRAVIGTVHPNCQCQMIRVPEGWGFSEEGEVVPGGEFGEVYADEEELELAMLAEDDLQKAFKLQGHLKFQGLPIAIENRKGTKRTWKDADGNTGITQMYVAYGYIEGTQGADQDEIDVFIGPDPNASNAFVVHQGDPGTGRYDEDKCMLGFPNEKEAVACYRTHYDLPDQYFLTVSPMPMDQFKRWISNTGPKKGEMGKSGILYVIPMDEPAAKSLSQLEGAGQSPAGNRGPGPGLGINHVIMIPEKPRQKAKTDNAPGVDDYIESNPFGIDDALHVDREVYDFMERYSLVHPIVTPEQFKEFGELAREDADRFMAYLKQYNIRNSGLPANSVEVGDRKKPKRTPVKREEDA